MESPGTEPGRRQRQISARSPPKGGLISCHALVMKGIMPAIALRNDLSLFLTCCALAGDFYAQMTSLSLVGQGMLPSLAALINHVV